MSKIKCFSLSEKSLHSHVFPFFAMLPSDLKLVSSHALAQTISHVPMFDPIHSSYGPIKITCKTMIKIVIAN